jgi:hypothetical protein
MSTKRSKNLRYIVGIIVLIAFGIFAWLVRPYVITPLSDFLFIVLIYGGAVLALAALDFRIRPNLKYFGGILALTGFGIFTWWIQLYVFQGVTGVDQLAAFMYLVLGYATVILALSALKFTMRVNLKYVTGIIVLTGFGAFTWYSQAYVSPQLGVFFGFVLAYLAAVLTIFYVLGRHGG